MAGVAVLEPPAEDDRAPLSTALPMEDGAHFIFLGNLFRFLNLNPNLNLQMQKRGLRLRLGLRLRGEPKNMKCTLEDALSQPRLEFSTDAAYPLRDESF
jgi:hypothetical protein